MLGGLGDATSTVVVTDASSIAPSGDGHKQYDE